MAVDIPDENKLNAEKVAGHNFVNRRRNKKRKRKTQRMTQDANTILFIFQMITST